MDDFTLLDLLAAYCAGSLPEPLYARVESAVLASPDALRQAMELMVVNDVLLAVRAKVDDARRASDRGADAERHALQYIAL